MLVHFQRVVGLGIKNLVLHKVRSLLTMLGIVFGVGSVIAMLAVGEGASQRASQSIARMGSSNIILESVEPPQDLAAAQETQNIPRWRLRYGLAESDRQRILNTIPHVDFVHIEAEKNEEVTSPTSQRRALMVATTARAPEVRNLQAVEGRFFTELEDERTAPVCVLSPALRRKLFPFGEAVGRTVRIQADYYTVVGVFSPGDAEDSEEEEDGSAAAREDVLYLPFRTARTRVTNFVYSRTEYDTLIVRAEGTEHVPDVATSVEALMDATHREQDYRIIVPLELLAQARQTQRLFNVILGSIAAISLLVGGIGIMNIMLATVTERTREIGIRRALGAKKRDIVLQFLIETVILSGAGGIIGVALGLAVPLAVTHFAGMVTIIQIWAPTIAFAISVTIGVLFGIYPAMRAAEMNPVEALRHE